MLSFNRLLVGFQCAQRAMSGQNILTPCFRGDGILSVGDAHFESSSSVSSSPSQVSTQRMAPWITGPLPPRQTQERKTTLLRTFSQFAAERPLLSIQNTVAAAPRVNKRSSAFDNSLCKFTTWKPVVVRVCASRGQGTGARRSTVETPFPETGRLSKPL